MYEISYSSFKREVSFMPLIPSLYRIFALLSVAALLAACANQRSFEQNHTSSLDSAARLGTVEFPASCSSQAQSHFLRGVAALHSFWYPVALDEFRAATRIDAQCMMGYWGEAMAHNHPIWGDPQETDAARKVIQKITITQNLTAREQAYINAVKILYGDNDKAARDKAYAAAMEKIYREHPDDDEAALFYALALMGTVGAENPTGLEMRLRAGKIASAVFKNKPDHPGAAHYVIHAYDDPKHARMALPAARRYAQIAPAAPHALHMPSHIFLQLGVWPEAASSNKASWAASDKWVREHNLPISQRDYHSLHWLQYAYLQQGRFDAAQEALELMRRSLAEFPKNDMRNLMYGTYLEATMAASYVIETERWDAADQVLGSLVSEDTKPGAEAESNPYAALAAVARTPAIFAHGFAAAMRGSPEAQKSVETLQAISRRQVKSPIPFVDQLRKMAGIQALEITALQKAKRGEFENAVEIMRNVLKTVDAMPPPSGPPTLIKPASELFGEILLRADLPQEAAEQFTLALQGHPNRARSLLGAARAFHKAGDLPRTSKFYSQFAQQWHPAKGQLPELVEARRYAAP
jgi:tetratricopeptide (TPR) repeat protein